MRWKNATPDASHIRRNLAPPPRALPTAPTHCTPPPPTSTRPPPRTRNADALRPPAGAATPEDAHGAEERRVHRPFASDGAGGHVPQRGENEQEVEVVPYRIPVHEEVPRVLAKRLLINRRAMSRRRAAYGFDHDAAGRCRRIHEGIVLATGGRAREGGRRAGKQARARADSGYAPVGVSSIGQAGGEVARGTPAKRERKRQTGDGPANSRELRATGERAVTSYREDGRTRSTGGRKRSGGLQVGNGRAAASGAKEARVGKTADNRPKRGGEVGGAIGQGQAGHGVEFGRIRTCSGPAPESRRRSRKAAQQRR